MRIAVLGTGSIGKRHLRNLIALGQKDLLAYDPSLAACESANQELRITTFTKLEEVWELQPEIVFITSPSSLHLKLALPAAEQGCHLFIEKPLSHSLENVDKLLAVVQRNALVTMVGCNMRFHPGPVKVKSLIDQGAIGQIIAARVETGSYLPNWRPHINYLTSYSADTARGGGAILDCIHEVDLALWYLGKGKIVGAAIQKADTIGADVDGLAELLVRHETGSLSSIGLNFIQRDYHRTCQVIGEKGTIYWDFNVPEVKIKTGKAEEEICALPKNWDINQMYLNELSYFLACVKERTQTFCSVADGANTLRLALSAKEVAQKEFKHL